MNDNGNDNGNGNGNNNNENAIYSDYKRDYDNADQ